MTQRLPTYCPSWCSGGFASHQQASEEGCTIEESSRHYGPDYVLSVDPLSPRNGVGFISEGRTSDLRVQLSAENCPSGGSPMPFIELEIARERVALTTGEARVLIRQLLHLADLADLD